MSCDQEQLTFADGTMKLDRWHSRSIIFCLVSCRPKPRPRPCAWPRPPTSRLGGGSLPDGRRVLRRGGCGLFELWVNRCKGECSELICFLFPGLVGSLTAAGSGHAFTSSMHPPPTVLSGLPSALLWPLWHMLLSLFQRHLLLPPSRPHLPAQTHLTTHLTMRCWEETCRQKPDDTFCYMLDKSALHVINDCWAKYIFRCLKCFVNKRQRDNNNADEIRDVF